MPLSDPDYKNCVPSNAAQKVFASLLLEDAKIVHSLHHISILGMAESGQSITHELARLLKSPFSMLPPEKKATCTNRCDSCNSKQLRYSADYQLDPKKLLHATILLIDSAIISPARFQSAVDSLYSQGVSSIIPLSPLLNKEVLMGNIHPLKRGIFWKTFNNRLELQTYLAPINRLEREDEIRHCIEAQHSAC